MATLQEVQDKLTALSASVGTLATDTATALTDLKAKIDALSSGGGATPEQLDALSVSIDPIAKAASDLDAAVKAADPGP